MALDQLQQPQVILRPLRLQLDHTLERLRRERLTRVVKGHRDGAAVGV
jgi:hypothetical protein